MEVALDFETASSCNLRKSGAARYAQDPSTYILSLKFQLLDADLKEVGPMRHWTPETDDDTLRGLASDPSICFSSHASFEQEIWASIMVPVFGFSPISLSRWIDTQALAAYHAIPLSLDGSLRALDLPVTKDLVGRRITLGLSRIDKKTGNYPVATPQTMEQVYAYNEVDVVGVGALRRALGGFDGRERQVWELDQRINQRGVRIDIGLVHAARQRVDQLKAPLVEEFRQLTGGLSPTQRSKIVDWLSANGVALKDLRKDTIEEVLKGESEVLADATDAARRALYIRSLVASSSLSKLDRMWDCVAKGGRAYYLQQYHAASTGRWAGRLIQPQNFPRPPKGVKKYDIDEVVGTIHDGGDLSQWGEPLEVLIASLRHCLVATDWGLLGSGDFAGVEARLVLALAGQHDKCALLASGADVYRDMASDIFELDKAAYLAVPREELTPQQTEWRQTGKNCLAANTLVLTDRGWHPIIEVLPTDRLWDGEEWVAHDGLVSQGVQPTVDMMGVSLTPDHMVFNGEQKFPAAKVVLDERSRSLVLASASANLQSSAILMVLGEDYIRSSCSVLAEQLHTASRTTISAKARQHAALPVPDVRQVFGVRLIEGTQTSCLMTLIVRDCSTEYPYALIDATTPMTATLSTTVDGGYMWPTNGAGTGERSSLTLSPFPAGTSPNWRLTGSITQRAIALEILLSSATEQTWRTDGRLERSKPVFVSWKPVYDLANAGPRHRFTIMTSEGPLIVANTILGCGFGMGWKKFWMRYCQGQPEEFAKTAIKTYREVWAPLVPLLWKAIERAALFAVQHPDKVIETYGVRFKVCELGGKDWLVIKLPNGKKLWYLSPRVRSSIITFGPDGERLHSEPYTGQHVPDRDAEGNRLQVSTYWEYLSSNGPVMKVTKAYGGLLTENIVQAMAREMLVDAMFALDRDGWPIVLTVHDEIVVDHPKITKEILHDHMLGQSPWADAIGMPIEVECWVGERYRK